MNTLQKALLPNGLSAFISGVLIASMNQKLAVIFGIENPIAILIPGIVIAIFGLTVLIEVKMQRALATLWIITQDSLWVIGTVVLVVFQPFELTEAAYWILVLYALTVVVFVWFQSDSLILLDSKPGSNRKLFAFRRVVKSSKADAWKIISDIGNYHKVASNIDDVKIVSGEGKGLVRQCSHGKDSWSETCTLWDEGNAYSFLVDTQAKDYPYPLQYLQGTWRVNSLDANKSVIAMEFEFEYKKKWQNLLIHPFMKTKFTKTCRELLDTWQFQVEGRNK